MDECLRNETRHASACLLRLDCAFASAQYTVQPLGPHHKGKAPVDLDADMSSMS